MRGSVFRETERHARACARYSPLSASSTNGNGSSVASCGGRRRRCVRAAPRNCAPNCAPGVAKLRQTHHSDLRKGDEGALVGAGAPRAEELLEQLRAERREREGEGQQLLQVLQQRERHRGLAQLAQEEDRVEQVQRATAGCFFRCAYRAARRRSRLRHRLELGRAARYVAPQDAVHLLQAELDQRVERVRPLAYSPEPASPRRRRGAPRGTRRPPSSASPPSPSAAAPSATPRPSRGHRHGVGATTPAAPPRRRRRRRRVRRLLRTPSPLRARRFCFFGIVHDDKRSGRSRVRDAPPGGALSLSGFYCLNCYL